MSYKSFLWSDANYVKFISKVFVHSQDISLPMSGLSLNVLGNAY